MNLETKPLGGYYGINREIISNGLEVIIRFYPLGNYDVDLEFIKKYESKESASDSIKKYIDNTILALENEIGPVNDDWKEFERKVNQSMVKLFRQTINDEISLPDYGFGYVLNNRDMEEIEYWVKKSENGEDVEFVNYKGF